MHYFNFQLLSVDNSIQEGVSKVHLNFTFNWWDSLICDCICQKNMIKKLTWDHVFEFKTLSFYCAFVCTFHALFSYFAFRANFAFCQSCLRHRAFFLPFMPALYLHFMPLLFLPFMSALFYLFVVLQILPSEHAFAASANSRILLRWTIMAGQGTQVCASRASESVFSCWQLVPLQSVTLWKRDNLRQVWVSLAPKASRFIGIEHHV